jgi:tetratricopeptide (TPR) repeat protein
VSWWRWDVAKPAPAVSSTGDLSGVVQMGSNNTATQIQNHFHLGSGPVPGMRVRHTLTAPMGNLVDRKAELEALRRGLADLGTAPPIRAVVGMGGVGKSALVRLVAHELTEQFPDVQYELNLHGYTHGEDPLTAGGALERLISWAGISVDPATDLDTQAGAWRDWLHGKKTLLILDNVRSFDQIECLLPGYHGCLVLITSRNVLDDARITNIALGSLAEADALELLVRRTKTAELAPTAWNPEMAEICRACGNIPAVINSVAAVLADYADPVELLAEMSDADYPLAGIPSADVAIENAFNLSYRALGDGQRWFFNLLAMNPGRDFTVDLAAALADSPKNEARTRLRELRDRNLIEVMGTGRFGFHDLYLTHARRRAPDDQVVRAAALRRVATLLLDSAIRARDTLTNVSSLQETADARIWVSVEHANLVSVTLAAAELRSSYSWDLAEITTLLCGWLGFVSVNVRVWRKMLSMAQEEDGSRGEARALRGLADAYRMQGRFGEALSNYSRAQQIFHENRDIPGEANVWCGLGDVHRVQGRLEVARDAYTRAKSLSEDSGNLRGTADALWGLGNVLLYEGKYSESRAAFDQGQSLFRQVGDRRGEAQVLRGLADVERMLEHHSDARRFYTAAMAIYEAIGDLRGQAQSLRGLGHLDRIAGDYETAVTSFARAHTLSEEVGDLRGQANMLRGLGDTERQRGGYAEARDALTRAIEIHEQLDDRSGLGYGLRALGDLEREQGHFVQSRQVYERGLAVFRERNALRGMANILSGLAELALAEHDPNEARTHFTEALRNYEELQIADLVADCRVRLDRLSPT